MKLFGYVHMQQTYLKVKTVSKLDSATNCVLDNNLWREFEANGTNFRNLWVE